MDVEERTGAADGGAAPASAEVVVVGCGPTGLVLAAELALGGVDVVVIERRADQQLPGSRAGGLHARTIEVLDQRGVAERFLAEGETMQVARFADSVLDLSDFPTRHPYGLALWQSRIEVLLAEWAQELPVRFLRGRDAVGAAQDERGATVQLTGGEEIRAGWVVGCDGGRSVVRKAAGIAFEGWEASTSYLLAEAEMPDDPQLGFKVDEAGRHAIGPLDGEHRVRFVVNELPARQGAEPSLEELREAVVGVWGTDFGLHSPTWISRFTDAARQAAAYREGRILIAGDAAHVHSPVGGQGLNTGVQDAVNLGWKLAQVVRGTSPDSLLDTYHAERHPVGARAVRSTLAQTAAMRVDERSGALRDTITDLLTIDEPRRRLAGMMSGLDIHYDPGEGHHPLVGRRMPDRDLVTVDGSLRVYELLHAARPVLLDLSGTGAYDLAPWGERTRFVSATSEGPWELPVLGAVEAPDAVLVRPDGYVAWTGSLDDAELPDAITAWFGAA